MGKFTDTIWVNIDELTPHAANRELFNPPTLEEYERIKKSLKDIGNLIHPLVITEDKKIISGCWRVKAAKELGIKKLPARVFYPSWPGEEIRVLIDSNVASRTISLASLQKIGKKLLLLKPPEEVKQSLIPPLQKLFDRGEASYLLLAELSVLPKEKQEEFYKLIKHFFFITGEERVDSENFEKFKQVSQQNEDAIKKLEDLEKELTEKNSLVEQLQKKILQAEAVKESSVEKMKKMESELEELKEKLEKAKEEGKKELEQETQNQIDELVKKLEETDSKRMELVRETAKLKDELEQKKNRIKALEAIIEKQKKKIREIYKEVMEEAQQKAIKAVEKKAEELIRKEKALQKKEQEIVSQQFRSKVLRYYSDAGQNDQQRAAYLWLQNAKFQLQSMVSFLGEVDTRARVVFGIASEFALPEELETLRRELKGRLEEIIDAAELVIDTMENPENPIMDKIKEWARKATAPLRDDGNGNGRDK